MSSIRIRDTLKKATSSFIQHYMPIVTQPTKILAVTGLAHLGIQLARSVEDRIKIV